MTTLLKDAEKVIFHGHNVTAERTKDGWTATRWDKGLPTDRRPISQEKLMHFMANYHHSLI